MRLKLKFREEAAPQAEVSFEELAKELEKDFQPPEGWVQLESYPVYGKYVFSSVHILAKEEEDDLLYFLREPPLNDEERLVVNDLLSKLHYLPVTPDEMRVKSKAEVLREKMDGVLRDFRIKLDEKSYYRVFYYLLRDTIFYGPITPLMYDPMIEDISCNGYEKPIYIFHRSYANLRTNITFQSDELDRFVIKLAQQCGKHISIAEPMVDATMPDGSRIQMTLGKEVTDHGSTFTIRKFRQEPLTPINLIKWGTFSAEQMAYLWLCIENKKSLIFAGGTASGKTTSTNAVALFIPRKAKIVTIEDTRELMLPHKNWIPAVTREAFQAEARSIDMYDLLRAALRQRPEYIIVGEVRGKEALTLFQAMSTGHTTYSTLHADSVNGVIHRLENPPINVPRPMIEALDIVSIQAQTYVNDKRVRRNTEIAEIVGLDPHTKMLRTTTVFQWDSVKDEHVMVGASKALEDIRKNRGWSVRELQEELERRRQILEYMAENNIMAFKDVANVIYTYQADPDRAMRILGILE
ncbi:type II/IV secretion system ATPase subunit [Archaeoglobus veneficus]|uniref:Type II secretion system protein E n=1 Tax=Archaeoglobus veneficus (strain DSM 11195 / SNP6) TaxID=693661 RepID=F2KQ56_ARCVS|nr:type II/IV secretion system ATPase subunit [Archaeoglobus veneficus]AEA47659.1 type II secretion system protein E [Archaeoglobus veneficus SNP6]